jgi:hypothetical protein
MEDSKDIMHTESRLCIDNLDNSRDEKGKQARV